MLSTYRRFHNALIGNERLSHLLRLYLYIGGSLLPSLCDEQTFRYFQTFLLQNHFYISSRSGNPQLFLSYTLSSRRTVVSESEWMYSKSLTQNFLGTLMVFRIHLWRFSNLTYGSLSNSKPSSRTYDATIWFNLSLPTKLLQIRKYK